MQAKAVLEASSKPSLVKKWGGLLLLVVLLYLSLFFAWAIVVSRPLTGLLALVNLAPVGALAYLYMGKWYRDSVQDIIVILRTALTAVVAGAVAGVAVFTCVLVASLAVLPTGGAEDEGGTKYTAVAMIGFISAYLVAALIDTLLKYALITRTLGAVREPLEVLVMGCAVGLGFSIMENSVYIFLAAFRESIPAEDDFVWALFGNFVVVPMHAVTAMWMACSLGRRQFYYEDSSALTIALMPAAVHWGFYALIFVWSQSYPWVGLVLCAFLDGIAFLFLHHFKIPSLGEPALDVNPMV